MEDASPANFTPAGAGSAFDPSSVPIGQLRKFAERSCVFVAGLILVIWIADALLGMRAARTHSNRLVGGADVYPAIQAARAAGNRVESIYLGDSVARQLFRSGAEPSARVRFLTTNQAISVAGQYYLLRDALEKCPNVHEVVLLYYFESWANNLYPPLALDYFCGYFHKADEVADVFLLKRDFDLSARHAGRWLMPNLLAENSIWRPAWQPDAPPGLRDTVAAPDAEPLLRLFTQLGRKADEPLEQFPDIPSGPQPIAVSVVSRHYLQLIRDQCRLRGIRLRVIPAPCPDDRRMMDVAGVYDANAPMLYLDRSWFRDGIHFKKTFLSEGRQRAVVKYGLVQPKS